MHSRFLFFLLLPTFLVTSCKHKERSSRFDIIAYNAQDDIVHAEVPSLKGGNLDLTKGDTTNSEIFFTCKNQFFYGINQQNGELVRYTKKDGKFILADHIPFASITGWEPVASFYSWTSDDQLLIGSSRRGRQFMYAIIDVAHMRIIKHGLLNIPLPKAGERYGGVMGREVNGNLYIAYMYYRYDDRKAPAGDRIFLATVNYPQMTTRKITSDSRSTFPGGYNLFWQVSVLYDDYLYFIANPGSRLRFHPTLKPAILRVKIGEDHIDPGYFFPLANPEHHEFYGLFDIDKGQAIVKSLDTTQIKNFDDFFYANTSTYYQLNLEKKEMLKLNFPIDRLDFHPNIYREDDTIRVAIADRKGGSEIWSHTLGKSDYKKGLYVNGQVIFIKKLK